MSGEIKSYVGGIGEYDVGVPGVWSFQNYGGALTQFALYSLLKSFGLSVLMIERPKSAEYKPDLNQLLFGHLPYQQDEIAPLFLNLKEMYELNNMCRIFLVGSDQVFNNYLYNKFGRFLVLDWVRSNKRKIAFSCSFGFDYVFGSEFDRAEMQRCLHKFDFFSVREKSGVDLCQKIFDMRAAHTLDPVFLCDQQCFLSMLDTLRVPDEEYYFAYILDPNERIEKMLKSIQDMSGKKIICVCDAEMNMETIRERWGFECLQGVTVEQWLALVYYSKGVITDSFHGTSFSVIYNKQFISIANKGRGITRFESLLSLIGCGNRLIEDSAENYYSVLTSPLDYKEVHRRLDEQRVSSINWLKNALFSSLPPKAFSDYDAINVRCDWMEDDFLRRQQEVERLVEARLQEYYQKTFSYQFKRVITAIPRMIYKCISCCRGHGLRYTINRIEERLLPRR